MDLFEAFRHRHCVREFDPKTEVPESDIRKLLEAAIEAPSGGNRQPWHFIVVHDHDVRKGLVEAAHGQEFLAQAPVVIVVCAEPERTASRYGERGATLYCLQDTAAATEHILLAATAMGLGSCWVGAFDEAAAARVLVLPDRLRPVAMIPIGRPAVASSRHTSRRHVDEVVSYR